MSPHVRRACWFGFVGCAVQATGLAWAAVGTDSGRWLVVAGVGLTLLATVAGLWSIGWRGLAVASLLFLGVGTAGATVSSAVPRCSPVRSARGMRDPRAAPWGAHAELDGLGPGDHG